MPQISVGGQRDLGPLAGPLLQAAIAKAAAEIPQEKKGQWKVRLTLEGMEAEAAIRLVKQIQASVYYQRRMSGEQTLGAQIGGSF